MTKVGSAYLQNPALSFAKLRQLTFTFRSTWMFSPPPQNFFSFFFFLGKKKKKKKNPPVVLEKYQCLPALIILQAANAQFLRSTVPWRDITKQLTSIYFVTVRIFRASSFSLSFGTFFRILTFCFFGFFLHFCVSGFATSKALASSLGYKRTAHFLQPSGTTVLPAPSRKTAHRYQLVSERERLAIFGISIQKCLEL